MTRKQIRRYIIRALGGPQAVAQGNVSLVVAAPVALPAELQHWHIYLGSVGHVIVAELEDPVVSSAPVAIGVLPIPLRAVLASEWRIDDGLPVVKSGKHLSFHTADGLLYNPEHVDLDRGVVTDRQVASMHREILDDVHEIRVLNRWGWSTDYAVRCSRKTAERAWGKPFVDVPADATFRVRWITQINSEGHVMTGMILEAQVGKGNWTPLPEVERTSFRAEVLADQLGSYLDHEVPEHVVLASIDELNLRAQLDQFGPGV
jgi:hypothetical protein